MTDWMIHTLGILLVIASFFMAWLANRQHAKGVGQVNRLMASRQSQVTDQSVIARVMRVVSETATDATGVSIAPAQLRLTDRLDSDLQLGLDSLSYFNLEAGLSKEFGIRLKHPWNCRTEPTIESLVGLVEEQISKASVASEIADSF